MQSSSFADTVKNFALFCIYKWACLHALCAFKCVPLTKSNRFCQFNSGTSLFSNVFEMAQSCCLFSQLPIRENSSILLRHSSSSQCQTSVSVHGLGLKVHICPQGFQAPIYVSNSSLCQCLFSCLCRDIELCTWI